MQLISQKEIREQVASMAIESVCCIVILAACVLITILIWI